MIDWHAVGEAHEAAAAVQRAADPASEQTHRAAALREEAGEYPRLSRASAASLPAQRRCLTRSLSLSETLFDSVSLSPLRDAV